MQNGYEKATQNTKPEWKVKEGEKLRFRGSEHQYPFDNLQPHCFSARHLGCRAIPEVPEVFKGSTTLSRTLVTKTKKNELKANRWAIKTLTTPLRLLNRGNSRSFSRIKQRAHFRDACQH